MESLHWSRILTGTAACEEEVTQQQVSCQNLWPMKSLHWGNPFLKDYTQRGNHPHWNSSWRSHVGDVNEKLPAMGRTPYWSRGRVKGRRISGVSVMNWPQLSLPILPWWRVTSEAEPVEGKDRVAWWVPGGQPRPTHHNQKGALTVKRATREKSCLVPKWQSCFPLPKHTKWAAVLLSACRSRWCIFRGAILTDTAMPQKSGLSRWHFC